jgi:hypothetical protein
MNNKLKNLHFSAVIWFLRIIRFPTSWTITRESLLEEKTKGLVIKQLIQGYIFFGALIAYNLVYPERAFIYAPFIYAFQYIEMLFTLNKPEYSILEIVSHINLRAIELQTNKAQECLAIFLNYPIRVITLSVLPVILIYIWKVITKAWIVLLSYHAIFWSIKGLFYLRETYIPKEYHNLALGFSIGLLVGGLKLYNCIRIGELYMGVYQTRFQRAFLIYSIIGSSIYLYIKLE